jgi:hypothetical protein
MGFFEDLVGNVKQKLIDTGLQAGQGVVDDLQSQYGTPQVTQTPTQVVYQPTPVAQASTDNTALLLIGGVVLFLILQKE